MLDSKTAQLNSLGHIKVTFTTVYLNSNEIFNVENNLLTNILYFSTYIIPKKVSSKKDTNLLDLHIKVLPHLKIHNSSHSFEHFLHHRL